MVFVSSLGFVVPKHPGARRPLGWWFISPCFKGWGQAKLDTAWWLLEGLVISPSAPVHNFWQRSAGAFCRATEPVVRAFVSEGHAA